MFVKDRCQRGFSKSAKKAGAVIICGHSAGITSGIVQGKILP
jgi:hypothetical protein